MAMLKNQRVISFTYKYCSWVKNSGHSRFWPPNNLTHHQEIATGWEVYSCSWGTTSINFMRLLSDRPRTMNWEGQTMQLKYRQMTLIAGSSMVKQSQRIPKISESRFSSRALYQLYHFQVQKSTKELLKNKGTLPRFCWPLFGYVWKWGIPPMK